MPQVEAADTAALHQCWEALQHHLLHRICPLPCPYEAPSCLAKALPSPTSSTATASKASVPCLGRSRTQTSIRRDNTAPSAALLYSTVYEYCAVPGGKRRCSMLYQQLRHYLKLHARLVLLPRFEGLQDASLLAEFVRQVNRNEQVASCLRPAFLYSNEHYRNVDGVVSTDQLVWEIYRRTFESVSQKVFAELLVAITARRKHAVHAQALSDDKQKRHETLVRVAIAALVTVDSNEQVYRDFEKLLHQRSVQYFSDRAHELMRLPLPYLIDKVSGWRTQERAVMGSLLPHSSHAAMDALFHETVLLSNRRRLFYGRQNEWNSFFCQDDEQFLRMLFDLFRDDRDCLVTISELFQASLVNRGNEALQAWSARHEATSSTRSPIRMVGERRPSSVRLAMAAAHPSSLAFDPADIERVEQYFRLHEEYHVLATRCCESHELFTEAIQKGFGCLLDKNVCSGRSSSTEALAHYCDYILNKRHSASRGRRSDQEVETYLHKLADLFRFVPDLDLFTSVYSRDLAVRLLEDSVHSVASERSMAVKLRVRSGPRFTSRIEGMIADMATSRRVSAEYASFFHEVSQSGLCGHIHLDQGTSALPVNVSADDASFVRYAAPMEVKLLTRGFWPSLSDRPFQPPREFAASTALFERYYSRKHERHLLSWVYSQGSVILRMLTQACPYTLIVTTYQACVLVLFKDSTTQPLTLKQVCQELRIEEAVGKRVLHSLTCGRFKVLRKQPDSPVLTATDTFEANPDFSPMSHRIKLPEPFLHETPKASRQDHSVAIRAGIVRVMKSQQTMAHDDLAQTMARLLQRFRPRPQAIVAQIKNLLDNDYLRKDPHIPNLYHYIP